MCINNNTEEWVNEEMFEAIRVRDKKYQRIKRTRLPTDHANYRKSLNQVKNLIKNVKDTDHKHRKFVRKSLKA